LPIPVALLSFVRSTPPPDVVSPDREPRFKECAGDSEFTPERPSQQVGERLSFFGGQVLSLVEEERAVQP